MDPWEVVKWIAIFRLILPEALFRLCGGRVENLGELQATAVKAGLNGVMMGNFLTTLGNTPEQDRAMFEELGLNVARQAGQRRQPAARQPQRLARRARRPDVVTAALDQEAPTDGADGPPLGSRLAAALRAQAHRATAPRRRAEHGPGTPTREAASARRPGARADRHPPAAIIRGRLTPRELV